jgi:hypothetical protein
MPRRLPGGPCNTRSGAATFTPRHVTYLPAPRDRPNGPAHATKDAGKDSICYTSLSPRHPFTEVVGADYLHFDSAYAQAACLNHTQPVGFGRPAILQAPFAGPDGNSSYIFLRLQPVSLQSLRIIGATPNFR